MYGESPPGLRECIQAQAPQTFADFGAASFWFAPSLQTRKLGEIQLKLRSHTYRAALHARKMFALGEPATHLRAHTRFGGVYRGRRWCEIRRQISDGAVIHQQRRRALILRHTCHCTGSLLFRNAPWILEYLSRVWDMKRGVPNYDSWNEVRLHLENGASSQ